MSFADVLQLHVVAATLVDGHLAQLTAVALSPKTPDLPVTLHAKAGNLETLGHKMVAVYVAYSPPPSGTMATIYASYSIGYEVKLWD